MGFCILIRDTVHLALCSLFEFLFEACIEASVPLRTLSGRPSHRRVENNVLFLGIALKKRLSLFRDDVYPTVLYSPIFLC